MGEQTIPVGYQGVPGAYSHLALRQYFAGRPVEARNYMLFEDVINAVMKGEIRYGVLPIENSSTGGITEVYDLVRRYGAFIVGEKIVKVEHCLLAWPGAKLEDIREVYSHPQGFSQCRTFFKEHPAMRQFNYFNTAKAAELVAEKKTGYMAAVAGAQAAEQYGLAILARGINTNQSNYTRFIVISRERELVPEADKITLIVSLKHQPGSLYRVLSHFARYQINMTNIESRPIPGRPWEYYFHMDITGHLTDPAVRQALADLPEDTTECKILGNYPADHGKEQ
ncbi:MULTISPECIES: prephenate dehydratase [Acidaminococcus]|jgi:chorismate mutase/prephenate dehydratase|uniref:Prephenate dehydratase n=1 Tax=Acidaminococcus fermentans TaxID=905 RepID=A0A6N7W410_ACIFE|nr:MULTISPECIES: prephenate dehydratase [Acidaminococcus]MSS82858.1 prephenate dehydratase [Acidaminococcus fermentans]CDE92484.1 prephenate dehydratase [Acidaminococcus sp. CAG:542]